MKSEQEIADRLYEERKILDNVSRWYGIDSTGTSQRIKVLEWVLDK